MTVRELNRDPAGVLARAQRGERLIVSRHGRPIATLQPFDGCVVDPLTGAKGDIFGSPLGTADEELAKLTELQRDLLLWSVTLWKMFPFPVRRGESNEGIWPAVLDLKLRGLVRKCEMGLTLTGRGMVLREALLAREGLPVEITWKVRRRGESVS